MHLPRKELLSICSNSISSGFEQVHFIFIVSITILMNWGYFKHREANPNRQLLPLLLLICGQYSMPALQVLLMGLR